MSQLSSRETSDMEIDDESFDQANQHTESSTARSHSFLNSDSDTASVKSVNELAVDDKDLQSYCTDEENYVHGELYDQGEPSTISPSNTHPEEESCLTEDMSIDDESFLEAKENINPIKSRDSIISMKRDYSHKKRLYQG